MNDFSSDYFVLCIHRLLTNFYLKNVINICEILKAGVSFHIIAKMNSYSFKIGVGESCLKRDT